MVNSAERTNLTKDNASSAETGEKITVEYNYTSDTELPNCTFVKVGNKQCDSCSFCSFNFTVNSEGTSIDMSNTTLNANCTNIKYGLDLSCGNYTPVFYPLEVRQNEAAIL
jgi:hypothetical protein